MLRRARLLTLTACLHLHLFFILMFCVCEAMDVCYFKGRTYCTCFNVSKKKQQKKKPHLFSITTCPALGTSHHFITEPHSDKHPPTLSTRPPGRENRREPLQTQGEHASSLQGCLQIKTNTDNLNLNSSHAYMCSCCSLFGCNILWDIVF